MSRKKLLIVPGVEAHAIAHAKYKVARVTVAVVCKKGRSWTAYACEYSGGHNVMDEISEIDIEHVPRFGKQISSCAAREVFSWPAGLWASLNGRLGQYQEPKSI